MRLTCPNCNAQYEVDEKVIPQGGRDVQCSACGHTWFQYPMEVALQMRAAEAEEDEDDDLASPPSDGIGRVHPPRIDKSVLDVLREEAARELNERQKSRGELEMQGELGLTRPTRSKAAPSRIYGEDDPTPSGAEAGAPSGAGAGKSPQPVHRRDLLPDIEELTSTLEPAHGAHARDAAAEQAATPGEWRGFRNGMTLVLLVGMLILAIYVLAPLIAAYIPALDGVLTRFVSLIDGLRFSVSQLLRGWVHG